jgi:RHS repeat-associated protein
MPWQPLPFLVALYTLSGSYTFTNPYIGLVEMGARWYDSRIGHWTSPDTIIPDPANPQSLNRFSYVLNNPLRLVDPTGHWYYDPGCRCLVKTRDSGHNYWIDPVSTRHHSGSRYLNYDETAATNPRQGFIPQDAGAALAVVAEYRFDLTPFELENGRLFLGENYVGISFSGGIKGLPNPHFETNIKWINDSLDLVSLLSTEAELVFKHLGVGTLAFVWMDPPAVGALAAWLLTTAEILGLPSDSIEVLTEGPMSEEGAMVLLEQGVAIVSLEGSSVIFLIPDTVQFYEDLVEIFSDDEG